MDRRSPFCPAFVSWVLQMALGLGALAVTPHFVVTEHTRREGRMRELLATVWYMRRWRQLGRGAHLVRGACFVNARTWRPAGRGARAQLIDPKFGARRGLLWKRAQTP